jgi:hypothetical protein
MSRTQQQDFIKKHGKRKFNHAKFLAEEMVKLDPRFARVNIFDLDELLIGISPWFSRHGIRLYIRPKGRSDGLHFSVILKRPATGVSETISYGGTLDTWQGAILSSALSLHEDDYALFRRPQ